MEKEPDSSWEANEELLAMLMDMGISKIAAEHALFYTGNNSAEAAASYVFDNPDIDQMSPAVPTGPKKSKKKSKSTENSSDGEDENYKMVFIVNTSLNMGVGKIASQVAHACLNLYRTIDRIKNMEDVLEDWEEAGEKKVVLKGESHIHLQNLEKKAQDHKVHSYLIQDAGRTQIPANSVTVLALFGSELSVNLVSGELSLL